MSRRHYKKEDQEGRTFSLLPVSFMIGALFTAVVICTFFIIKQHDDEQYAPQAVVTETVESTTVPDEYNDALKQAQSYVDMMPVSESYIHDLLVDDKRFSDYSAQYAIDNLQIDWNQQALRAARILHNDKSRTLEDIANQLASDFGGKFTEEQVKYAIDHL